MNPASRLGKGIESLSGLDAVAEPLHKALHRLLPRGKARDLLSGTPLGHPLHPVLTDIPLGLWTGATLLDVVNLSSTPAATTMVGVGVLSALPTALAGWSDWADTTGAEQRVGLVHAAFNIAAIACFGASWLARRRGKASGVWLSLTGVCLSGGGAWLGGHLVYGLGVGVDTNAFEAGPTVWTRIDGPAPLDGDIKLVEVDGIRVVLATVGATTMALADRCSHRGGPLSEGDLEPGSCIRCPWHSSSFELATGDVRKGPATAPQPVYELRRAGADLEIRRVEDRSLRTNAVRSH